MKINQKELTIYSGIAIIFVVFIHASNFYMMNVANVSSIISSNNYFIYVIFRKIINNANCMFIFIAGYKYMLSNKYESYKIYFRKKIKKMFKPFIVISSFFIILKYILRLCVGTVGIININIINDSKTVLSFSNFVNDFIRIFTCRGDGYNIAGQLWFIPMYLSITLIYPFITKILKSMLQRVVFFSFLMVAINYFQIQNPLAFASYFLVYEMGVIFHHYQNGFKENKILKASIIAGFLMSIIMDINIPYGYANLMFQQLSLSFQLITFYYLSTALIKNKLFMILGKYSYAIFLFHLPVFLTLTAKIIQKLSFFNIHILGPIIVTSLVCISVTLSTMFNKFVNVTFLRKIIF